MFGQRSLTPLPISQRTPGRFAAAGHGPIRAYHPVLASNFPVEKARETRLLFRSCAAHTCIPVDRAERRRLALPPDGLDGSAKNWIASGAATREPLPGPRTRVFRRRHDGGFDH